MASDILLRRGKKSASRPQSQSTPTGHALLYHGGLLSWRPMGWDLGAGSSNGLKKSLIHFMKDGGPGGFGHTLPRGQKLCVLSPCLSHCPLTLSYIIMEVCCHGDLRPEPGSQQQQRWKETSSEFYEEGGGISHIHGQQLCILCPWFQL